MDTDLSLSAKPKFADYMLYLNDGKPIAVVEAKDNNHSVSHGLQQAMRASFITKMVMLLRLIRTTLFILNSYIIG